MTVGRRQYNEAEMMQMQREAEMRVREMQNRSRKVIEEAGELPPPSNRNWHSNPGMPRGRNNPRHQPPDQGTPPPPSPPPDAPPAEDSPPPPDEAAPPKSGTVVGDIMDALGLDEDYLLIIGLILILINQRADTTLILALAYLLF